MINLLELDYKYISFVSFYRGINYNMNFLKRNIGESIQGM